MDPGLRSDGEPVCRRDSTYYHDPHDGSDRGSWLYFDLVDAESKVVAPPHVARSLRESMVLVRRHLDSWDANLDAESLHHTIAALAGSTSVLQEYYRELFEREKDMNAPIASIDLEL